MFLKRITVRKNGKLDTYWALIQSIRTARGPRHQTVAYLGELGPTERAGWAEVRRILEKAPKPSPGLFERAVPPGEPVPENVAVRVRDVPVAATRDFGDVYLGWVLWRALGLDELLRSRIPRGKEVVPWPVVAAILALARFCEPSSELHIEDTWYRKTALGDRLGVLPEAVNTDRLYRGLDEILPHKEALERHLKDRFATMFDASYDLVLYDVTSTYFEGLMEANPQAKRGHSRDKRPDCLQVTIALQVTREGLPIGYEVFSGNRNDMTTLEEIVEGMERKHGSNGRIWVVDRGIASEKNLDFLRKRGASYVVGTPKSALRGFQRQLLEGGWSEVEPGVDVKACPGPDGTETFVLCRSGDRREKEKAMHERFAARIEEGLAKLAGRLERAKKPVDRSRVERQIGRLMGRNSRAAGGFEIRVEDAPERASGLKLTFARNGAWCDWAALREGSYTSHGHLLRLWERLKT